MNGTRVIAHIRQLLWFGVLWVVGILDGFGRPDAYMAICPNVRLYEILDPRPLTTSSSDKP